MASTAPIPCIKCGAVLAHADGGAVPVSGRAVAVGKVILLCTGCGAINVSGPKERRRLVVPQIPLDMPETPIQTNPLDSSRGPA